MGCGTSSAVKTPSSRPLVDAVDGASSAPDFEHCVALGSEATRDYAAILTELQRHPPIGLALTTLLARRDDAKQRFIAQKQAARRAIAAVGAGSTAGKDMEGRLAAVQAEFRRVDDGWHVERRKAGDGADGGDAAAPTRRAGDAAGAAAEGASLVDKPL